MVKILDRRTPLFVGFLQSLTLSLYIFLVGSLMTNSKDWFSGVQDLPILAPMVMLTLFIFSAVISGTIVLGYPLYLFWIEKKVKRALTVVFATALFLLIFLSSYIYLLSLVK